MSIQQKIGGRPKQRRIDVYVILDVGGGEDGRTRRDSSEQRQSRRRGLRQTDAARDARYQLDCALRSERPQMLIDSLPILQPQPLGNLPARRRQAAALHETADKSQHFQLFGSEIGHAAAIPDGCLVWSLARLALTASSVRSK